MISALITLEEMAELFRCTTNAMRIRCDRDQMTHLKICGKYMFTEAMYHAAIEAATILDHEAERVRSIILRRRGTPPLRYFQPISHPRGQGATPRKNTKLARKPVVKNGG